MVRQLAAYGVLPNGVFWLLGTQLYMARPIVNIDYLLEAALGFWLPASVVTVMVATELALDAVINVAPSFHLELRDLLRSLGDVINLNLRWTIGGIVAIAAGAAIVALAARALAGSRCRSRPHAVALATTAVLVFALDAVNGTSLLPITVTSSFVNCNIANSAVAKTGQAALDGLLRARESTWTPLDPSDSATGPLLAAARTADAELPPRIGIVSVESWGIFRNQALAKAVVAPLTANDIVRSRYRVEEGTVPFRGVTIDGEFRELCGIRLERRGDTLPGVVCLPKLLQDRGYDTTALHGFTSRFYNRFSWYPALGFKRASFAEDLRARGLTRKCGSGFDGLCDPDVGAVFGEELMRAGGNTKRLVYWMTLNSHTPLSDADGNGASLDCAAVSERNETACLLARLLNRALLVVAQLALDPRLPPAELIVVGDHAPALLGRDNRGFVDQQRVPFVRLVPLATTAAL